VQKSPVNIFSISISLKNSILIGIVNSESPLKIKPQLNKFLFSDFLKLKKKI
jgi:hypothetical protein